MSQLIAKTHFESQNDAKDYILSCEDAFAQQMRAAAARILSQPSCKLLGLGGPSCAGKSTTAKLLIRNCRGSHSAAFSQRLCKRVSVMLQANFLHAVERATVI